MQRIAIADIDNFSTLLASGSNELEDHILSGEVKENHVMSYMTEKEVVFCHEDELKRAFLELDEKTSGRYSQIVAAYKANETEPPSEDMFAFAKHLDTEAKSYFYNLEDHFVIFSPQVTSTEKQQNKIVKCISCGYVGNANDGECGSCDDSDLYASPVGETASISCMSDDHDLMSWCEDNTYDITITQVDDEGLLVWDKDCPYAISTSDLE